MVKLITEVLVILFALFSYYRGGFHSFFKLFVFFIPFKAVYFEFGASMTLSQLFLILVVIHFLIIQFQGKNSIHFHWAWLVLILYAVFDTAIFSFYIYSSPDIHTEVFNHLGALRTNLRPLVQVVRFVLFSYLIYIIVVNYYKDRSKILEVFKTLISSIILLSALGIVQLVVFQFSGIDIFPIERLTTSQTAILNTGYYSSIRVTSLGGEPKSFGMICVFGLVLLQTFSKDMGFSNKYLYTAYTIISIPLVLTFSTSAYILLILFFSYKILFEAKGLTKLLAITSIVLVVFLFINQSGSIINLAIQDRLLNRSIFEDFDSTIISFLVDNKLWLLLGSGLGNIHNLAYPYIDPLYGHYMYGNIFVAKSGYLRIISELGLIGFILFGIFNFQNLVLVYKKNKNLFHLAVLAVLMYLARGYLFYEYIVTLSLCYAYAKTDINT